MTAPQNALASIIAACQRSGKHIVLAEGEDQRVQQAAARAVQDGLAEITLLGEPDAIAAAYHARGEPIPKIDVIDPAYIPLDEDLVELYLSLRAHKGADRDAAIQAVRQPLIYAALMLHSGRADGSIAGAVHTTAEVVRAAVQLVGAREVGGLVSSCFIVQLSPERHPRKEPLIFTDCGLVVEPNSEQLAAIAAAGIASCRNLLNQEPKVAMLSFSTCGSARHERVSKVIRASQLLRQTFPDLSISSDIQFDAAFVPAIGRAKAPELADSGNSNVFVFPNLEAGNIGYKIAQYIGGATAIGPILQGLRAPANDLSRGCSTSDIYNMIAITALQAVRG